MVDRAEVKVDCVRCCVLRNSGAAAHSRLGAIKSNTYRVKSTLAASILWTNIIIVMVD